MMRQALFAAMSVICLTAITTSASPGRSPTRAQAAAAPSDLYCLQGVIWGYPGNCQFSNYAQCMASASGTVAYCDVNPRYLFAEQRRGYWPPR
jgi:hypothetical protein